MRQKFDIERRVSKELSVEKSGIESRDQATSFCRGEVNLRTSQLTSNRQHPVSLLTSTVSSTPLAPRTPRVQCPLVAQLALCSFAPAATRVAHSRILYRCLSYCWLSVQRVRRCACAPPSPSHCAAPPHHHRVTLSMCLVGGSVVQRVEGTVQEYSARDTKSRVQRVYRESRVH